MKYDMLYIMNNIDPDIKEDIITDINFKNQTTNMFDISDDFTCDDNDNIDNDNIDNDNVDNDNIDNDNVDNIKLQKIILYTFEFYYGLFNMKDTRATKYIKSEINVAGNTNNTVNKNATTKIANELFNNISDENEIQNVVNLCCKQNNYETDKLDSYIRAIRKISKVIKAMALTSSHLKFNVKFKHPNLQTSGKMDMLENKKTIIYVKYGSDEISTDEKLNLFLQYHSYHNKWISKKNIKIWNFKTGNEINLSFNPLRTNIVMTCGLAALLNIKLQNMIFIYDLETTGLNIFKCDIIERYFHELNHDEMISEGVIKPRWKLAEKIIDLTGITQNDVNNGQQIYVFLQEMANILAICNNPIFIAQNGNMFDHKILKIRKIFNENCKCLDSRTIINSKSDQKLGNKALSKIYELVMGNEYSGKIHRAKADVIMILHVFKKLNITEETILRDFLIK